ncbi:MAG: HNH endonuclease [Bosea sp.]|uniref:HNH endonuclease n=1 Tax=Bosea sp. (in: a-proteobacteria) TaxID=1871050 RepID=UPI001AD17E71|nr:HNH endonuclease [Bosea sp. (in: a-proteobacteria)]MBN9453215.1 HNH endonuclease [Bosea sp. (in: a-proteobacteria)]
MTSRSVPEWIGKTPDAKIPPRVRLRVFERFNGICYLSGRKIAAGEPWECDHVVALVNGGEHRESNLAPALRDKHRQKTAEDVAEKSTVRRQALAHRGIRKRSSFPCSKDSPFKKKLDGSVVRR